MVPQSFIVVLRAGSAVGLDIIIINWSVVYVKKTRVYLGDWRAGSQKKYINFHLQNFFCTKIVSIFLEVLKYLADTSVVAAVCRIIKRE